MHHFILLTLLVILIIVLGVRVNRDKFTNYWVDNDIAMRSPDPIFYEAIGNLPDRRFMTPTDYYLENTIYEQQGIIPPKSGWDMYRPSDNYSPGYAMMGYKDGNSELAGTS